MIYLTDTPGGPAALRRPPARGRRAVRQRRLHRSLLRHRRRRARLAGAGEKPRHKPPSTAPGPSKPPPAAPSHARSISLPARWSPCRPRFPTTRKTCASCFHPTVSRWTTCCRWSPRSRSPSALFAATSPAFADLTDKLLRSLDAASPTNDAASADLSIASYNPLDPVLPSGNTIIFVEDETRTGA